MEDYDDPIDSYDLYDEYMDQDAIACANGDYNTWEENQLFYEDEYEVDCDVSDDNWAMGTLDVET